MLAMAMARNTPTAATRRAPIPTAAPGWASGGSSGNADQPPPANLSSASVPEWRRSCPGPRGSAGRAPAQRQPVRRSRLVWSRTSPTVRRGHDVRRTGRPVQEADLAHHGAGRRHGQRLLLATGAGGRLQLTVQDDEQRAVDAPCREIVSPAGSVVAHTWRRSIATLRRSRWRGTARQRERRWWRRTRRTDWRRRGTSADIFRGLMQAPRRRRGRQ